MAIVDIPKEESKWVIFFISGEVKSYFHSAIGVCTSYNDEAWTIEEYNTEEEWLIRLIELGIILE